MEASTKEKKNNSKKPLFFIGTLILLAAIGAFRGYINKAIVHNAVDSYNGTTSTTDYKSDISTWLTENSFDSKQENQLTEQKTNDAIVDSIKTGNQNNYQASNIDESNNSTPSKSETEKWILGKMNQYAKEYEMQLPEEVKRNPYLKIPGYETSYFNNFEFNFEGDYFRVKFNEINKRYNKDSMKYKDVVIGKYDYKIPIYDIDRIRKYYDRISFSTHRNTVIQNDLTRNSTKVDDYCEVGFQVDAETELIERLQSAFEHLKVFYKTPSRKEIF